MSTLLPGSWLCGALSMLAVACPRPLLNHMDSDLQNPPEPSGLHSALLALV